MTPDEMRARSSEKVKQVLDLMKVLHLRVEARERMSEDGFIEKTVFWLDDEKYQAAPVVAEAPQAQEVTPEVAPEAVEVAPEAPAEETA